MSLPSGIKEMLGAVAVVLVILMFTNRQGLLSGKLSAQEWMDVAKYLGGAALVAFFLRRRKDTNE